MKKKNSYLVLVRHGESEWNAQGLWSGWYDIGLTKKGEREAKQAAVALSHISFHHAFTSPLQRAYKTLEIMKKILKYEKLPTTKSHHFKERHYGEFTGKNKWEIKSQVGEKNFLAIRRGWDVPIKYGETLKDVFDRVMEGYHTYILPEVKKGQNILFVAHGNTIRALVKHLEEFSDKEITHIELATGEVLIYELTSDGQVIKKEKRLVNKNNKKTKERSS